MKKKKPLKIILIILAAFILLTALASVFIFRYYFGLLSRPDDTARAMDEPSAQSEPLPTPMPAPPETPAPTSTPDPNNPLNFSDVYSILLLGNDSRLNANNTRTDTMMLVTVNKANKEIILTSFMRDIYINIPDYGYQRLNAANVVGGPEKVVETIETNFGIVIDNYALVNFYTFMDVVDAIGGITIDLDRTDVAIINRWVYDYDVYATWEQRVGLQYVGDGEYDLTGMQALAYCRSRDIDGDFHRTLQQRRVIEKIWEKAKTLPLRDLLDLAEIVLPQIYTDIDELTALSLLGTLKDFKDYTILQQQVPDPTTFEFWNVGGASVLGINFENNSKILHDLLYGER